jgi:GntR family transcriptional regulator of arabinose operon
VKKKKLKYELLKDWLIDSIRNGAIKKSGRLPSENFLCRKFDISRQTVRKALSELRDEGIIYSKQGSGSYVNRIATVRSSNTIGVLVSHVTGYLFSQIINGIDEVFSSNDYGIDLSISNNRIDQERKFLFRMLNSNISGLIVEGTRSALPNPNIELYQDLRQNHLPIIFIHNYYENFPCPSVMMDDINMAQKLTDLLIEANHRKIAGIFKGDDLQGHRRYSGYVKALIDAEIPVREEIVGWFYSNYYDHKTIEESIADIVASFKDYTAIVCYNDVIAQEVYRSFKKQKIRIPDDISMVSFDDIPMAQYIANGITSGQHPHKQLGIETASRLLAMINDAAPAIEAVPYLMPYTITVRDSIKRL